MEQVTLLSVNWNQRDAMELMLKSFALHHYEGKPMRLRLVDNNSTDESREWLKSQQIPFVEMDSNIGHEQAINYVYDSVDTPYCLLLDTDVEFKASIKDYLEPIMDPFNRIISTGDLITGDQLNAPVKPRIGAWFWLFDISYMKTNGILKFRDTTDWSYDVGSWYWEQMQKLGMENVNLFRHPGHIDRDIEGMVYDRFVHYGKVSWDLDKHADREYEVKDRRAYIKQRLEIYKHVDLKGKFTF